MTLTLFHKIIGIVYSSRIAPVADHLLYTRENYFTGGSLFPLRAEYVLSKGRDRLRTLLGRPHCRSM